MVNKIGFIGCGNMGSAIAKAISKSSVKCDILLSDPSTEKMSALSNEVGAILSNNEEIAKDANWIFLAVKPQIISKVIFEIKETLKDRKNLTVISMAAGVDLQALEEHFGFDIPIIRIMPNTPVAVSEGVVLYTTNDHVSKDSENTFKQIMEKSGTVDKISEKLINSASALSGCGPAFVYMFIESLADGAVSCGLTRDKAIEYAAKTLIGASSLLLETGIHPEELKDAVCSPGGSTIEGVRELENGGLRSSVINAVVASFKKTVELGK